MLSRLKRFLFGIPIRSEHAHHERLTKFLALPVFSSDALSSVAYGTEEILRVLVLCIPFAMSWNQVDLSTLDKLLPISIGIAILLIIVVISYVQTIFAYPGGGGSYIVTSENLGSVFGRIAGGSLLIDYTLTVAVSISAGVAAIVSAFPGLSGLAVEIALALLAMITWANLRGVRESGAIFALPTYSFIVGIFIMLGVAFWKFVIMGQTPVIPHNISPAEILPTVSKAVEPITLFFLLRAFSAGCTALTGIEAISDGVAAFRKPEARNAAITLGAMGSLLVVMFVGICWLANFLHVMPITEGPHYQTVLSQIARATLDSGGLYFFIQIATMSVLVLAANTAFADFPRLSYFMARDGFLPRQLMAVGDRLVYQNGIVTLAAVAVFLIWTHDENAHLLIPLYSVGVFVSFTLSQAGMAGWQIKHKRKAWMARAALSAIGSIVTGTVAMVIFSTKFKEGAYMVAIALGLMLFVFSVIHRHYSNMSAQLVKPEAPCKMPTLKITVLLLVPRVHKGLLQALNYAKTISPDTRAVHVNIDPSTAPAIRMEWEQYGEGIPLVVLETPYRSLLEPILEYVDETLLEHPNHVVTVIVPEYVPRRWWQSILHQNLAFRLKLALASRKNVVVTNVRYFLET